MAVTEHHARPSSAAMASDRDHEDSRSDITRRTTPGEWPADDAYPPSVHGEAHRQNGGHRTPDSGHRLKPTTSGSSAGTAPSNWDNQSRKSGERNRSRHRSGRSASGQMRVCKKCGEALTGQFVRALDGTFHLDCFKCRVWFLR